MLLGVDRYAGSWLKAIRAEKADSWEAPCGSSRVAFRPFDRVTRVPEGTTVFNAAHWIGLPIESTCGGRGTCGQCKVQVLAGEVEVAPADRRWFSDAQLAGGWRLACEATLYADAECHVPALMRAPKAATMGLSRFVLLEPNVHKVHLVLPEPSLEDARSDVERLRGGLDAEGYGLLTDLRALRHLPIALRSAGYDVTAVLCGEHLVPSSPATRPGSRTASRWTSERRPSSRRSWISRAARRPPWRRT